MKTLTVLISIVLALGVQAQSGGGRPSDQPLLVNHNCMDINRLPLAALERARQTLHIAYGHTSHGSQITDGMIGLVAFANGGGRGLNLPENCFAWNNGGSGGALDLHDYAMGGDVGSYPDWVKNTRTYLNRSANGDVNVILWSWCGQVTSKYQAGTLDSEYLLPMTQLEADYPGVTFVYMTGHVDHGSDAANKAANQAIRDYCTAHNKVLYDFADIECYNPDGVWFEFPADTCEYYASASGPGLGNWAQAWQNSHTVNRDWYSCESAHSEPLNANQKAYAAWWLFARLAGWGGPADQNSDGRVDLADLALMSRDWLENCPTADIAPQQRDGVVNVLDLQVIAGEWLES